MRKAKPEANPIDLQANLKRIAGERAEANRRLAEFVTERSQVVVDGSAENVLRVDQAQILELARIEQCDARLAVIRREMDERQAEAEADRKLATYEAAKASRVDGERAVAEIKASIRDKLIPARARLITAKSVVAEANRNLPPGCAPIPDPEGEAIGRGWPSILDQLRVPLQASA